MFKKILRTASFLALIVFIVFTALFKDIIEVEAAQMGSETNEENSMGIVIEKSNETIDSSKITSVPDLGDDQAFPFIPGFGKNSGKD